MCARVICQLYLRHAAIYSLLAASVAFSAATARCEEPTSRQTEWVEIKSAGDRAIRALVARPESPVSATVVVLLHEDRGLTNWERRLADQLATAGYLTIAPDLLSDVVAKGSGTDSFDTVAAARAALYDIKADQIASQLDAVCDYASKLSGGDKRIVVVGFGWGGGQAFLYASHNPRLAATAVFYGAAPTAEQVKQIQSPVYGFYAENDTRITGEITKVRSQMAEAERYFEGVTYAGAKAGFFRTGEAKDASPADLKARSEAWSRLIEILKPEEISSQ